MLYYNHRQGMTAEGAGANTQPAQKYALNLQKKFFKKILKKHLTSRIYYAILVSSKERGNKKMMTYYFDVDGVLADFHSVYDKNNRSASLTYNFIRNLKPFVENVLLVKKLIADGNRVYINTMVANENTKKARIDWLAEFLPEVKAENIITVMGHGNKADYIREDGILVDDKKANCRQWEKAGHKAIWLENKGEKIEL